MILCAAGFAYLWKRARPVTFGIVWFFVTLAPVLDARWMGVYVLADRYLYIPSAGFCIVAGWACLGLWRGVMNRTSVWRTSVLAAACFAAALCALRISLRVLDWQNDVTILSQASAAEPGDYRMHDGLGLAYWFRGDADHAEREWQTTLRLEPNSAQSLEMLGALYAQRKRYDLAVPLLERSLQLNPDNGNTHLNLGAAYAELGKLDLAEEQFRAAVLLSPMNYVAHNMLGKLYYDSNRLTEAQQQFRQSLDCEPNLAAYDHLGYISLRQGDNGRAEIAFKSALAMNGNDSRAHYNLGLIYAAAGRKAPAVAELKAALAADPHNPEIASALERAQH